MSARSQASAGTAATLHQQVANFYNRFPYPSYPLLLPLRWQEGYMAHSGFAGRLRQSLTGAASAVHQSKHQQFAGYHTVLVAGSGETLPYIIRRQEPSRNRVLCLDLSETNLRRAAIRNLLCLKRAQLVRADVDEYLQREGKITGPYDHVDVYGVLHHTANPSIIVKHLAERLHPQGTMRLMVYNSQARHWILHIQRAFRVMGLDPYRADHLEMGRALLRECQVVSKALKARLDCLASTTIRHPSRFADTFFHAREARISVHDWFRAFRDAGLTPYGLFDRYGELDDLNNPLWSCPSLDQLVARVADLRFENNFELFLCRDTTLGNLARPNLMATAERTTAWRLGLQLCAAPPKVWFSFTETRDVPYLTRVRLWQQHVRFVHGHESRVDALIAKLPLRCKARLARVGAILPGQLSRAEDVAALCAPLADAMEPPQYPAPIALNGTSLSRLVVDQLQDLGRYSDRRFFAVMRRFAAAQSL